MTEVIEEFTARLGWDIDTKTLTAFQRQMGGLKNTIRQTFYVGLAGATALGFGIKKVMGAFSLFEDAEAAFTPLLGGARQAQKAVQMLSDTAATTPYQFEQLAGVAKLLLPSMNKDIEKTIKLTRTLGDTAGGNIQNMESIVRGYSQVLMKGKVTLESLNILSEGGKLPIIAQIADYFGKTTKQVYALISAGKVSAEDLTRTFKKMTSVGGLYYKGMQIASETLTGRISTMKDNIVQTAAELGHALAPAIKRTVDEMIAYIPKVKEWFFQNRKLIEQGFDDFVHDVAAGVKLLAGGAKEVYALTKAFGGLGNVLKIYFGAKFAFHLGGVVASLTKIADLAPGVAGGLAAAAGGGKGGAPVLAWGAVSAAIAVAMFLIDDMVKGTQGKESFFRDWFILGPLRAAKNWEYLTEKEQEAIEKNTVAIAGLGKGGTTGILNFITTNLGLAWELIVDWTDRVNGVFSALWDNTFGRVQKLAYSFGIKLGEMQLAQPERFENFRSSLRERLKGPQPQRTMTPQERVDLATNAVQNLFAWRTTPNLSDQGSLRNTALLTAKKRIEQSGQLIPVTNVTVMAPYGTDAKKFGKVISDTVNRELEKRMSSVYWNYAAEGQ